MTSQFAPVRHADGAFWSDDRGSAPSERVSADIVGGKLLELPYAGARELVERDGPQGVPAH